MHIALCGPMSPSGVSELLTPKDALRAEQYPGFGGVPVYDLATGLGSLKATAFAESVVANPPAP